MNTQRATSDISKTVATAVRESRTRTQIVTIECDSTEQYTQVCTDLDGNADLDGSVDAAESSTHLRSEYWGTTDGSEWRVHVACY